MNAMGAPSGSDDSRARRLRRRGRAVRLGELTQDVRYVAVDCVLAEHERRRDLAVAHSRRDESQDLGLARAERGGAVQVGRAVVVQEACERAEELALVVLPGKV